MKPPASIWPSARLPELIPHASPLLLALLGAQQGRPQAPIRAELFGPQRFTQHGRSLGATHHVKTDRTRSAVFFPRLRDNVAVLRLAQRYIAEQAAVGYDLSPAAEWLLDNFHLIEAQLKEVRDGLPARYFHALPVLRDEPLAGLPRVYGVAWAFVAHTDSAFDEDLLVTYLVAYQETRELTLGEMWALPTTLRVVLIENLRRLAERVATLKAAREVANRLCDEPAAPALQTVQALHRALEARGAGAMFLAQLWQRTQSQPGMPNAALQAWLQAALPQPADVQAQHNANQAADNLSVSNAIHALRAIAGADWPDIVARTSRLMGWMLQAPSFTADATVTRDQALHCIEALARSAGRSEVDVAQALLSLMQSTGPDRNGHDAMSVATYWLQGPGRPQLSRALGLRPDWARLWGLVVQRVALPAYLGGLALGTAGLLWLVWRGAGGLSPWSVMDALVLLLMVWPASEAVVAVINRLISESARPAHLSRLAFTAGIPPEHRVLVAIPSMLSSPAAVKSAVHRLHLHYLANREPAAQFVLLSDWSDAATERSSDDQMLLDQACAAVQSLNQLHPVEAGLPLRFIVLHRQRRYSASEGAWIGWERKRGKLQMLLAAMVRDGPQALPAAAAPAAAVSDFIDLGPLSRLAPCTPYVVTLDGDTELPPGRLRELVSIAAHPQNRPQLDTQRRVVRNGWGILQPRVATPLPESSTPFHWLFAGQCGIDPYSAASSEVYQDLFGEGSFSGKGLLHVQAVHAVLAHRFPDNQVLSHDLLEGSLARCAVVTDVTVLEDAPFHADVAAARLHRWTRGDWQLLPFLLQPRRYPLRAINRWKLLDNLRRSLVAPASLGLLVLVLAGPVMGLALSPAWMLALVLAGFTAGPLMGAVAGLAPSRDDIAKRHFYAQAGAELARALGGGLWHLSHLLAHALMSVDAIARALWRTLVSRHLLLQWTTAAAAESAAQAKAHLGLSGALRAHWSEPLVAALLAAGLWSSGSAHLAWVLGLCGLWALAPVFTWWASRAPLQPGHEPLSLTDHAELQSVARDNWRFFERCVGPQDRHLPPDNLQTDPTEMVAHRTSPTNIGLYLLSIACARQFGWIGTQDLLQRLEATLATLATLERCHGHFLNWYDTQTGAALLPRYVSSVDSGNLSGHLLSVAQACRDFAAPVHSADAASARALAASGQRLAPLLARFPGTLESLAAPGQGAWVQLMALPSAGLQVFEFGDAATAPARAAAMSALLDRASEELQLLRPHAEAPAQFDALPSAGVGVDLPASPLARPTGPQELWWCLADHLATLRSALLDVAAPGPTPELTAATAARLESLAQRCERLAWEADFACLYHPRRRLLHLGLRVAEQELDSGLYDLLASESRLTSLLAIAKADVPVAHWAALGRPFHAVGDKAALRSWSGSMFEYLMPGLVLAEPRGSVLRGACEAAVTEQIRFGRAQHLPWGVSESAYAARDDSLAYQYAPQGVPRLALRSTPPDDRVVAPYATAMAAQLSPLPALANLRALAAVGARHRYGYIEALDYTVSRLTGHRGATPAFTPVSTFMAHHQGMGIVALTNLLHDNVAQRWCMGNPQVQAVASLLHERAPRELPLRLDLPAGLPPQALLAKQARPPGPLREVLPGTHAVEPTHMLGNGSYSVTLRANGAGTSRWRGVNINRSRDDALRDALGSFLYLRLARGAAPVSVTQHPAPDPQAHYTSTFHADRVCFDATWPLLRAHTTVWVSPEDDTEFRQVDLHNSAEEDIELELISAFDVTLADAPADGSHPAFSNLFVSAHWRHDDQALVFARRPRQGSEAGLTMAHFLANAQPSAQANAQVNAQANPSAQGGPPAHAIRVQTDRALWWGRNQDASQMRGQWQRPPVPAAAQDDVDAPDSTEPLPLNTGLDPVCALSVRLRVKAQGQVRLTFVTAVTPHADRLPALIDKYQQDSHVQRASLMSATLMGIRLRSMGISAKNFASLQSLTTALVFTLTRHDARHVARHDTRHGSAPGAPPAAGVHDRRMLWRLGISGDRPLLLVSAADAQGLPLLRSLALALRLWAWGGVSCDLVVVNAEPASYDMPVQREVSALRDRHSAEMTVQPGGFTPAATGLFLLRQEELLPTELHTLRSLARVHLRADARPLPQQVKAWAQLHEADIQARQNTSTTAVPVASVPGAPVLPALGRFDAIDGSFDFDVHSLLRPLRPWINVLANPGFGCHVSETGGGHTWAVNSRLNQITAWSNDPLADPASDFLLLQDRRSGEVWSLTPSTHANPHSHYRVQHGQGSTRISHRVRRDGGDVDVAVTWCVDPVAAVKQLQVQVVNRGTRALHWRLIVLVEWQLGATRAERASVLTSLLGRVSGQTIGCHAVLATQQEHSAGWGGGTAFLALLGGGPGSTIDGEKGSVDWTCDRREFFDARGRLVVPDHLGQRSGAGLDPCAALATRWRVAAGATASCTLLMGWAESADAAQRLVHRAGAEAPADRLKRAQGQWDDLLQATEVSTPDPLFDALVNRWLLYQAVSCRLWAKAGFYQAGGATGFRDQLQDTLALSWAAPQMLRAQILLCASRQFVEGDVQHWWHAPGGAGVRTHFSDDLLWLPWACVHHARSSGELALLDETVPFLEGAPIAVGAEDAYDTPRISTQQATVYEHAALTIDRSLAVGVHGLPLMGSGDWNDGMNRVGSQGRGESVWLGWFLCRLVEDFAPLAQARGDGARAQRWLHAAQGWREALDTQAWDGDWYKRAFFDDGSPLGSSANAEARIDLIAQAWSVLSGAAPLEGQGERQLHRQRDRQQAALTSMHAKLVDNSHGLIRLLDPPLQHAQPSAGYIQAYPPGVRENGGQYSHGAIWALMAQARLLQEPQVAAAGATDASAAASGMASEAAEWPYRYFTYLSPAHRAADPRWGAVYGLEPYVMAGDVCSQPPYAGRGGWSWYTGAAAWMHRAAVESIFGLSLTAHSLCLRPALPAHWPQARMTLRRKGRCMRFLLSRGTQAEVDRIAADTGARVLRVGQSVSWPTLPADSSFVVLLPALR